VQHSVEKHMERDVAKIIRDTLDTFDTLDAAAKVKETTTPEHEEALVPCVDGSELARVFFTFAGWSVQPCVRPVSAAHKPLAIMPSADQVPVKSSHLTMRWH
jgi:hypothetical protein